METHLRTSHFTSLMNYEEQFRVELSEQFVSLQKMRQSSDTNEQVLEVPDDQEDSNDEEYNYPSIADMIETEIQVEKCEIWLKKDKCLLALNVIVLSGS